MIDKRFKLPFLLLSLILVACATAPVQEMSDARQALKAAEMAGARELAPEEFAEATQLVDDAVFFISERRYEVARVVARRARLVSIQARRKALSAASEEDGGVSTP